MKELFEVCYKRFPDDYITKKTILEIVQDEGGLFDYLHLDESSGRIRLGLAITKFTGRVLSDIRLVVLDRKIRANRQKLMFTKKEREEPLEDVFEENKPEQKVLTTFNEDE